MEEGEQASHSSGKSSSLTEAGDGILTYHMMYFYSLLVPNSIFVVV